MRKYVVIDFETYPIERRPDYPPKPVGVAITLQSGKTEYLAWGHPTGNNTTMVKAKRILKDHYSSSEIVMHHAKFDLEVGQVFMGLPLNPKHGFHCTMILAFLFNPRSWSLKLKLLAKDYLGIMPNEQLKLKHWIMDNVKGAKKSKTKWGQYIYLAPGGLVGQYAKADTKMTKGLFKKFMPYVVLNNMVNQYKVEKGCVLEAIAMESVGISIDQASLEPELVKSQKKLKRASNAIKKVLGDINLNSSQQKIEAFERLGLVDEWEYGEPSKKTKKVSPKTGIESLMIVCNDKPLVKQLEIYSKYTKLINTYMIPWLNSARENNGKFYPWINTIKGDNDKGTYTGRFSSNFQQVPKEPSEVFKGMPFLRRFIVPDNRHHTLLNRDYMGQELRILAHFGEGALFDAYNNDSYLDGHIFVQELMLNVSGRLFKKSVVKGCNFLVIYGGGANALSKRLMISLDDAKGIFKVHGQAVPEVDELKDELRLMARRGEVFITAGGRIYDFEEGFEYVALNTLIQSSAADHAKRGLLNISKAIKHHKLDARIMLQVHDEFMLSACAIRKDDIMKLFKTAMEIDKLFDVPMLTDGKIGNNWGDMTKFKD